MSTPVRFTQVTLLGRLALRPNDPGSWQEFYDRYGPPMLRWCRKYGCPPSDEQDVLQDVMIKIIKAFATFRYDENKRFRSWLKAVTKSGVNDLLRSTQFRTRAAGHANAWEAIQSEEARQDLEETIERVFEWELWEMACLEVRRDVEEKTWLAFQQTVLEKQTIEQASQGLEMSVASIYAARSRIKKRLEDVLARTRKELDGEKS